MLWTRLFERSFPTPSVALPSGVGSLFPNKICRSGSSFSKYKMECLRRRSLCQIALTDDANYSTLRHASTPRKCVTIAWSKVCKPKVAGRLGLRDPKQLNNAAVLKFSWDSLKSNTDWGSLFRSRFKVTSFQFSTAYMKSAIWPGIKEALPIIFLHCRWIVGNGKMVNFWLDRWVLNPIASVLDISSIQTHLLLVMLFVIKDGFRFQVTMFPLLQQISRALLSLFFHMTTA